MSGYCYLNFYMPKSQEREVSDFFKMLITSDFSDTPIMFGELKQLPPVGPSDEMCEFTAKITNMGERDKWVRNTETCHQILRRITEKFQTTVGAFWPACYIETATENYHDYVRSIVLKPSKLRPGFILKDISCSVRFRTDDSSNNYAHVNVTFDNPSRKELVLVIIAEHVSKSGTGINHPFNALHHLVDKKTQLEVGLQLDGPTNKHVRGLLVSKSLEDQDFKDRLLKEGLDYLEIP